MASTSAVCNSFKIDLMTKLHDFTLAADAFNWALYLTAATNSKSSTAYTTSGEHTATGTYVAKGKTVANITPVLSTDTAVMDWGDVTWASSTISCDSTMLFNDTLTTPVADASVAVYDFGGTQASSGGDFVLQMPTAAAGSAILELA
jgi:hypothetical protein